MQIMDFLVQVDKTSINFEQAKTQLDQAKLKFEQAKQDFDETLLLAEKFNLTKAKLKKLTEDRIQSLRENLGNFIGVEVVPEGGVVGPKKKTKSPTSSATKKSKVAKNSQETLPDQNHNQVVGDVDIMPEEVRAELSDSENLEETN